MSFLDRLTEALESPDLPDEDKWRRDPHTYLVRVEVEYNQDETDLAGVLQQFEEWMEPFGEIYNSRLDRRRFDRPADAFQFLVTPETWDRIINSNLFDLDPDALGITGKPWGQKLSLGGNSYITRMISEPVEDWAN